MHRRSVLKLAALPALYGIAAPVLAQQRPVITYAYLLDPAYDVVTWAMRNGKVASSTIDVQARALAIPQLIQATSAKQYDVIMAAVVSLPAAVQRGLSVSVLATSLRAAPAGEGAGVWVPRDSALKTPQDLKGKTLGSYGLRSTGYTQIRIALTKKYGLNMALEGGDVSQVEIQAPNLPGALASGKLDAATLIHSQAYRALKSGDYRLIAETARDNNEIFKTRFVSAVNIAYPERLSKQPEAYVEFCRVFRESLKYAMANKAEVFGAVGKESGLEPDFFEWWFTKNSEVPGYFSDEHAQAITLFYEQARDLGVIKSFPDIRTLVWDKAPRA
ncbi:MqnA/MqnD/SBP family protein [Bordetella sputigena]|uniref:ABC transporter substrate-binding protein n=1 Tax=Bordetella sputigena TaxID=1416810 RepID=UPI0039EFBDC6